MADTATSAAAPVDKSAPVKPERPDEAQYKENLAKAEKELKAAEERMVGCRDTNTPTCSFPQRIPWPSRLAAQWAQAMPFGRARANNFTTESA